MGNDGWRQWTAGLFCQRQSSRTEDAQQAPTSGREEQVCGGAQSISASTTRCRIKAPSGSNRAPPPAMSRLHPDHMWLQQDSALPDRTPAPKVDTTSPQHPTPSQCQDADRSQQTLPQSLHVTISASQHHHQQQWDIWVVTQTGTCPLALLDISVHKH